MNRDEITVEVRDKDLNRIDVVNPITAMFAPRHLGVGAWELTVPADDRLAAALRAKGSGIVVTGPWGTFAGPRTGWELKQSSSDPVGTLTVYGEDDNCLIAGHLVYPDPVHAANAQEAGYYTVTENAETLMHQLVNVNLGPSAHTDRKAALEDAIVMGTNLARGGNYALNARFSKLSDVLAAIGQAHHLGYRVTQDDDELVFETYEVQDRSALIRLNVWNGSLSNAEAEETTARITAALVAGQGEGEARTIRVTRDLTAEADLGRVIESFRDRRDTDDADILDQAGAEDISDNAGSVTIKTIPTDAMSMRYGADWREGDLIAVGDDEHKETVTGAVIRLTRTSALIAAKIGR